MSGYVSITTPHHLLDHFSVVEQNICILKLLFNSPLNVIRVGRHMSVGY